MLLCKRIGCFVKNIITTHGTTITSVRAASTVAKHCKYIPDSSETPSDKIVLNKLKIKPNKIRATYLWIDETGKNIRSKDQILTRVPNQASDLPWQCDISPSFQALPHYNDAIIVPRAIYRDPFKIGPKDIIAMCDTYAHNGQPTKSNYRCLMQDALNKIIDHEPLFGIDQEYMLLDSDGCPFQPDDSPNHFALNEAHKGACLYAGIDFASANTEGKYHIGLSIGMKAADDLWVSRYILSRIAKESGIIVSFEPEPIYRRCISDQKYGEFLTNAVRQYQGHLVKASGAVETLMKHARYDEGHFTFETSSTDQFVGDIIYREIRVSHRVANVHDLLSYGDFQSNDPREYALLTDPYAACNAVLISSFLSRE